MRVTCPLSFPDVRVRFRWLHPREWQMVSVPIPAQVQRVSVTAERLWSLGKVKMRPRQIIPGRHVIRSNVGKIWLVLAAQGRWCVDGLSLSTHIQTRWRVLAVVFVGMSLEGARVLVQVVRRVIVLFPIHDCHRPGKPCCTRAHEPVPCPWSGPLLYLQSERLAPIEGLIGVPPWPCDPAAPLVSLFTQSCQLAVDSVRVSFRQ